MGAANHRALSGLRSMSDHVPPCATSLAGSLTELGATTSCLENTLRAALSIHNIDYMSLQVYGAASAYGPFAGLFGRDTSPEEVTRRI